MSLRQNTLDGWPDALPLAGATAIGSARPPLLLRSGGALAQTLLDFGPREVRSMHQVRRRKKKDRLVFVVGNALDGKADDP